MPDGCSHESKGLLILKLLKHRIAEISGITNFLLGRVVWYIGEFQIALGPQARQESAERCLECPVRCGPQYRYSIV